MMDILSSTEVTTSKSPYCTGSLRGGAPTLHVALSNDAELAGKGAGEPTEDELAHITLPRPKACSVIFTPSQSPQTSSAIATLRRRIPGYPASDGDFRGLGPMTVAPAATRSRTFRRSAGVIVSRSGSTSTR